MWEYGVVHGQGQRKFQVSLGKILMISQTLFVLVEIQSSDFKVWGENLQLGAHLHKIYLPRLELYIKVFKHWIYFSKENKYEISLREL